MEIVVVKCSITKNKSRSHSELLPLYWMKSTFYPSHSYPSLRMVLALCHGGTAKRRFDTCKGICQVRDRSEGWLWVVRSGHIRHFCQSFPPCLSVSAFASVPGFPRLSPFHWCDQAQVQVFESHFNNCHLQDILVCEMS